MKPEILVTGFLGAGKSSLVRHAQDLLDAKLVELCGLVDPTTAAGQETPIVAAVDAINLGACLDDPLAGPLVKRQIQSAGLIVLTRTDAVDPSPALAALRALTDAEITDAPFGEVSADLLVSIQPWTLPEGTAVDVSGDYAEWTYAGPAILTENEAERLLENRPKGIYRLSGVARTREGGLDLQVTGRTRQITSIPNPGETVLRAVGPASRFKPMQMDMSFATAASASAHLSGMFSHR